MNRKLNPAIQKATLVGAALGMMTQCSHDTLDVNHRAQEKGARPVQSPQEAVARVDGTPIFATAVSTVLTNAEAKADTEMNLATDPDAVVTALVNRELLAIEAKRRGWDRHIDVRDESRRALARAMLKQAIEKGVDADTIDRAKLRRYYEANRARFVHDPQRRVTHIVITSGEKGLSPDRAKALASTTARTAKESPTLETFSQLGQALVKEHPQKVKLENLPPFEANSERFVRPFVDAAFAIPKINAVSGPIETKYGWHIIFLVEEIPATNLRFDDVSDQLAQEVLPQERELKAEELIDKLRQNSDVFIYEDVLRQMTGTP